jgi:hypothetical protein
MKAPKIIQFLIAILKINQLMLNSAPKFKSFQSLGYQITTKLIIVLLKTIQEQAGIMEMSPLESAKGIYRLFLLELLFNIVIFIIPVLPIANQYQLNLRKM